MGEHRGPTKSRLARGQLGVPEAPAQRLHDWLRGSPTGLVALAVTVGAGAGAGAVVFRYLFLWFTILFSGHADYGAAGGAPNPFLPALGIWFVILAPALGGFIYGPLVDRFAREARGHGVPEVMLAGGTARSERRFP